MGERTSYIVSDPALWPSADREHFQGTWQGDARRGKARARHEHGKEHGRAHPQEQQTNTTQWKQHTAKH